MSVGRTANKAVRRRPGRGTQIMILIVLRNVA